MSAPAELLRPGLLEGVVVATAGSPAPAAACARLGARIAALDADLLDEEATAAAVDPAAAALVVDAAALFASGGPDALTGALERTWTAVRTVVNAAFIGPARPGKLVLVAPAPSAGPHAAALRAGLENLARTTSIEWSGHGVTPTAVLPGDRTPAADVAELVAYLVSPAGDYFSGCPLVLN